MGEPAVNWAGGWVENIRVRACLKGCVRNWGGDEYKPRLRHDQDRREMSPPWSPGLEGTRAEGAMTVRTEGFQ